MPKGNPKPNTEGIREWMGKGRQRLDNETISIRMAGETRESLEHLAAQYGCFHGKKPHIGGLLAKIGSGELLVVPAPPASPNASSSQHS
jgi:hypothetical protein